VFALEEAEAMRSNIRARAAERLTEVALAPGNQ